MKLKIAMQSARKFKIRFELNVACGFFRFIKKINISDLRTTIFKELYEY